MKALTAIGLLGALTLAGCGGGGGDSSVLPQAAPQVPAPTAPVSTQAATTNVSLAMSQQIAVHIPGTAPFALQKTTTPCGANASIIISNWEQQRYNPVSSSGDLTLFGTFTGSCQLDLKDSTGTVTALAVTVSGGTHTGMCPGNTYYEVADLWNTGNNICTPPDAVTPSP